MWLYEQYNMEILLLYWIEMGFLGLLVRIWNTLERKGQCVDYS